MEIALETCINKYFIKCDEIYKSEKFNDEYIVDGKCIYEVIRIIDGVPVFLKEHLERLKNSIDLEKENHTITMNEVNLMVDRIICANEIDNGNIKIVINKNKIFIFSILHSYPTEEMYLEGVKTILYFGQRNNPNAKVIDMDFRGKVNKEIAISGSYEAILVNDEGYITEGSKSNIFMVKGKRVFTAPVEGVLPGITRGEIIKACNKLQLIVEEKNINYEEIKDLDGLFISGTSPNVLPIKEVQGVVEYHKVENIIYRIKNEFEEVIKRNLNNYRRI